MWCCKSFKCSISNKRAQSGVLDCIQSMGVIKREILIRQHQTKQNKKSLVFAFRFAEKGSSTVQTPNGLTV